MKRTPFFFLLAGLSLLALTEMPTVLYAASACAQYTKDTNVPTGYASPVNIFSSLKQLVVDATCTADSILIKLGSAEGEQLVYKSGYYWTGTTWETYAVRGGELYNDTWYKQLASASIPHQGAYTYFTGYVCVRKDNEWKCGCKDEACTEQYWQVQLAKRP